MEKIYRTSVYTIFVPLNDNQGDFLLVHGYTGAIDHVSAKVAHFLRKGKGFTRADADNGQLPFSQKTFKQLLGRGYLTSKTPLEERDRVRELAETLHGTAKNLKSYLFLVAYDCNFRCPYCFENGISSNGKGWSKKVFTKEMVDRAYEAMMEIESDRNFHNNRITLYGGEPLLAQNKEVVEYMVREGQKRGYTFKAITNGYELEHFAHLLQPGAIEALQITIDGSREKHNSRRTHYLHGNSYDKIMVNLGMALELGTKVNVRINTDLNNFGDIKIMNTAFKENGFYEYKKFSAQSALIHGSDEMNCNAVMGNNGPALSVAKKNKKAKSFEVPDKGYYDPDGQYINFEAEQSRFNQAPVNNNIAFHDEDFSHVDKIHTMNRGKYIQKHLQAVADNPEVDAIGCQDFGIRRKVEQVLQGKGMFSFRSYFCAAQTGMLIFDPYGDLYTCWELVGMDQHKVGKYQDEVVMDEEELAHWYGRNISKTPACSKCKYAFFCGGGCQAHALNEGRGYDSPYCDGYPKTFQKVVPEVFKRHLAQQKETVPA